MVIPYDQTSLALECDIFPSESKSSGAIHLRDPRPYVESEFRNPPFVVDSSLHDIPKSQIKGSLEGLIRIFA